MFTFYYFTDSSEAGGITKKHKAFQTCGSLSLGDSQEKFNDLEMKANNLVEADYDTESSACGLNKNKRMNTLDPAGKLNEEYDFFTGQKEVRSD